MQRSGQSQLPLQVQLRDDATFDNFLPATAQQVMIQALRAQAGGAGEAIIYLHGPTGSGKTHLLQASCHLAGAGAIYLPLAELAGANPQAVVQGIEALRLVCLDDVDSVLGRPDWELALFDLCNRAREQHCSLLVSAAASPRDVATLADLQSRLAWGLVYPLARAGDERKISILRFRAERRGLALSLDVCSYIVARAARDMPSLLGLLEQLDAASLAEQRALSIPFVKRVLGW